MKSSDSIILEDIRRAVDGVGLGRLKNAKILLLGASGLIGTYLSYLLYYLNQEKGFSIEADLYTRRPVDDDSRIALLRNVPGIHLMTSDISEFATYNKKYDFMIHAAGYGSPAFFLQDPLKTIDLNYIGMKSVLESALGVNPAATVLYLSSSEIYGSPTEGNFPTPESYPGWSSVENNRACYIESKRLAEVACLEYVRKHKMKVRIARPALSYGPGMMLKDGRVISQFIRKGIEEKVINMVDDGKDLRCFCYLSDVLREILFILLMSNDIIYNVGSAAEEISILDLAKTIGKLLSVEVRPGPGKDFAVIGAPSRVQLDLTKLKKEFGFEPSVKMEEGLRRTIDWNLALLKNN